MYKKMNIQGHRSFLFSEMGKMPQAFTRKNSLEQGIMGD